MISWVFDFDGVIADTMAPLINFIVKSMGVSPQRAALWVTGYGMVNKPRKLFSGIRRGQNQRFHEYLLNTEPENLQNFEVLEIIQALPGRKYILTSNYDSTCKLILGSKAAMFEDIISFSEVENKTQGLKYLQQKYKINSQNTIMITDTIGDILEFQDLKIPAHLIYGVTWGYHSGGLMHKYISPSQILHSYTDLLTIPTTLDILGKVE